MTKERLIDIDKEQFELLDGIVKQHIPSKTVWAYGSRVDWTANEKSDLDLVVFDCDPAKILALKEAFAESNLMVSVDVMDWESIPDNFKENIKKKYVVLQEEQGLTGWQEVRLGYVAKISSGAKATLDDAGIYPIFGANGKIGLSNHYLVDEKIIFTGRVGTLGNVFISNTKAWLSDNTLMLKPKDCEFDYMYYLSTR